MKTCLSLFASALLFLPSSAFSKPQRPRPAHEIEAFRSWMRANARAVTNTTVSLTAAQTLGKELFSDKNLSLNRNQACASCHSLKEATDATGQLLPTPGFVDPSNVNGSSVVSKGSIGRRFGRLNAPSVGYAGFSPAFHWDSVEGLYVGGQFWNGRAGNLQAQAAMPLLNPAEMAMPDKWAVVTRLKENPRYRTLFEKIYGIDLNLIPAKTQIAVPSRVPPGVFAAYDAATKAIAEFEQSPVFNRFTSKFDYYLAGVTDLTPIEKQGLELFNGKALCSACHISEPGIATDGTVAPPLFTDFTYDNIGLPRNTTIAGNPEPDPGLGGRADIQAKSPGGTEIGKHKVMSLRNIAITAPYGHNGVLTNLAQVVHFYNTRDVLGVVPSNTDAGFGITGWAAPEFSETVNVDELGNLQLTPDEEAAVVEFLKTLTDNYPASGGDPNVPPGTPSPFANTPLPPFP